MAATAGATRRVGPGRGLPGWLRAVLMVAALVVALAGWPMTFRDLSNPSRRR
ncbi:hypothetical protein ACI784_13110 [Geodermatophilus sp. SYSU D01186]